MEEEEVGAVLRLGVVDGGVGYGNYPLSIYKAGRGAVAREVKEVTRPGQLANLFCVEVAFKASKSQGSYAAYVDPRADHSDGVRLMQLWHRFVYLESADSHRIIVPLCAVVFKASYLSAWLFP